MDLGVADLCGDDPDEDLREDRLRPVEEELTEVEVRQCDVDNQRWKELVADLSAVETRTLVFAVPVKSQHAPEILKGLSDIYTKLRSLGLSVVRMHCDRARELISAPVRSWLRNRDIYQTTTSGDEPQGSGRAESAVCQVKNGIRLALQASGAPRTFWPLAARQVAEDLLRAQLRRLGMQVPRLLPFRTKALARCKLWQQ